MRNLRPTTAWGAAALTPLLAVAIWLQASTTVPVMGASGRIVPKALPITLLSTTVVPPLARVQPATNDSLVFLATADRHVEARKIADPATPVWSTAADETTSLAAASGLVFAASTAGLLALDDATGVKRWSSPFDASGNPLIVQGGLIVATSAGGQLVALHAADGTKVWQSTLTAPVSSPSSSNAEFMVTATLDRQVTATNLSDGKTRWTMQLETARSEAPVPIFMSHFAPAISIGSVLPVPLSLPADPGEPLVTRDHVYIAGDNGALYYLDPLTGMRKRPPLRLIGGRTSGAPVADARHLYVATVDGLLSAYGPDKGALDWKATQKVATRSRPLLGSGLVFIPLDTGEVEGYFSEDGVAAAKLLAPPTTEANAQLAMPAVLCGANETLRLITIVDTTQSWSLTVYGKGRLTLTPVSALPGRPLPGPGGPGDPGRH